MAAEIDPKLLKGLEKIFEKLIQCKLLPESMRANKKEIIESLAQTLSKSNFKAEDLTNPLTQMRVMGAMFCKHLGLKGMEEMFNKSLEKNPTGKPTELDKLLLLVLYMLKLQDKDPKAKLEPESIATKLLNDFKKLVLKPGTPKSKEDQELEEKIDNAKDGLTKTLRNMNAGVDIRISGGLVSAIAAPTVCDPGLTNRCTPSPVAAGYMVSEITLRSEVFDYATFEARDKQANLALGGSTISLMDVVSKSLAPALSSEKEMSSAMNYNSPRPSPFNIPGQS